MDLLLVWNLQGTPVGGADLGTPSAPPFMDMGRDEMSSEIESGAVHEIDRAGESTESHAFNLDRKEKDSLCDPGERYNILTNSCQNFLRNNVLLWFISCKVQNTLFLYVVIIIDEHHYLMQ